ncbi:ABC transporter permease [Nocardioides marinquilinus]|uniref:Xylose transport system permease protein XylH n=1 Tax=Nocardioides marinquilinus TaxID=1210400 RepID=A0ABP9Q3F9_9ACTN
MSQEVREPVATTGTSAGAGTDAGTEAAVRLQRELANEPQGIGDVVRGTIRRARGGDLGVLPVVGGIVVIWVVFQLTNRSFLSSTNLINLTIDLVPVGVIALGIVCVLLVGEIDLSVGSMSGVSAAVLGTVFIRWELPLVLGVLAALAAGALVGWIYAQAYNRLGVPSFVITLAGLLGLLGVQLWVLTGRDGYNLGFDSPIVRFTSLAFVPAWLAYALVVVAVAASLGLGLAGSRARRAHDLPAVSTQWLLLRSAVLLLALAFAVYYLSLKRGVPWLFVCFIGLVLAMQYLLTRTRFGRNLYAVGGNTEAARRAGIDVRKVYTSAFVLCSSLAALGGILAASRLGAATQDTGTGDVNLNAIAAAVIGGTSLFGGRGTAISALLGILVIGSISSGLTLQQLDSSYRFMITGAVLLLAVALDSVARRSRQASGRG